LCTPLLNLMAVQGRWVEMLNLPLSVQAGACSWVNKSPFFDLHHYSSLQMTYWGKCLDLICWNPWSWASGLELLLHFLLETLLLLLTFKLGKMVGSTGGEALSVRSLCQSTRPMALEKAEGKGDPISHGQGA
jgi:hypothetical protein